MSSNSGDPYILNVQKWINNTFGNDSRFDRVDEDGIIGWGTIYGLIKGLQIKLGISTLANNFGTGTEKVEEMVTEQMTDVFGWDDGYEDLEIEVVDIP